MANKIIFSTYQKDLVNNMFRRLETFTGLRLDGLPLDWGEQLNGGEATFVPTQGQTIQTLHVDFVNGNDDNDGNVTFPLKTLDEALSRTALVWDKYPAAIYLHAPTPTTVLGNWSITKIVNPPLNASINPWFMIQCADFTPLLGLQGPNTGTITASSGYVQTMASANWANNELQGWLLQITSGPLSGNFYPIRANTVTTMDIGHADVVNLLGASFNIVQPNVDFQPLDPTLPVFSVAGGYGYGNAITLSRLSITGSARGVRAYGSTMIDGCLIKDQTIFCVEGRYSDVTVIQYSYLRAAPGNNVALCYGGDFAKRSSIIGSVLRGPGNTGTSRVLSVKPAYGVYMGNVGSDPVFIENATSGLVFDMGQIFLNYIVMDSSVVVNGVFTQNGTCYVQGSSFIGPITVFNLAATGIFNPLGGFSALYLIDTVVTSGNNGYGILTAAGGHNSIILHGSTSVSGGGAASNAAIAMASSSGYIEMHAGTSLACTGAQGIGIWLQPTAMNAAVTIDSGTIQNCNIGIVVEAPGAKIMTLNTPTIQNNALSGVEFRTTHCSFKSVSGLVMTGNGGGANHDFLLSPHPVYSSLASLRALTGPPAKLISDILYHNTILE